MITHVTKETFQKEVLEASKERPVILDFYADWCGPCRMQAKIFEELDAKGTDFKVCKCNVDENEDLADDFGIETIPTLVFFKDGVKTHQISTVLQEPSIHRLLEG